MRTTRVVYPTGRELLSSYWGFLASGGITLDAERGEPSAFCEGDAIVVDVRIASLRKEYRLAGHIRRRFDGRALVAFDVGEPQDMLLNAAWADGQEVPERRHRRWPVNVPVHFRSGDGEGEGVVVDLSRGGLCLEADTLLRVGTVVTVTGPGIVADGRVRWMGTKPRRHFGVEFSRYRDDLVPAVGHADAQ